MQIDTSGDDQETNLREMIAEEDEEAKAVDEERNLLANMARLEESINAASVQQP